MQLNAVDCEKEKSKKSSPAGNRDDDQDEEAESQVHPGEHLDVNG